jgi:hypothetical protein
MRKSAISRTAKIEEKLDGLVSLLQSQAGQPTLTTPPSTVEPSTTGPSTLSNGGSPGSHLGSLPTGMHAIEFFDSSGTSLATGLAPNSTDASLPVPQPQPQPFDCISNLSTQETEESLGFFRSRMLPTFPFMYIPQSTTVDKFRETYPTLWLCIISITTRSLERKCALGDTIRETLARRIVVKQKRSLDLLLACVCFIGW